MCLQVSLIEDDDVIVKSTCPGGTFVVLELSVSVKGVSNIVVIFSNPAGGVEQIGNVGSLYHAITQTAFSGLY